LSLRLRVSARVLLGLPLIVVSAPAARAADLAQLEQQAFAAAAEAVADSVVQIRTIGGLDQLDGQSLAQGPTTGLIVRGDGYIVSSAFNFASEPTSILIRLADGTQLPAELIGRDNSRMLVLLKVDAEAELPTAESADLASVTPGDWAVAVGRTLADASPNISVGVVSALNRMHGRALQTDANVSLANYGGPLVDVAGRVLGVLVPMAPPSPGAEASPTAGAEFYDSGIGFAIPLAHIERVLDRWIDEKDLKRGVLGIGLKDGSPHATAPIVTAVWPKSPAASAGWKPKDRIVAVAGANVETQTQLRYQIAAHYAGDPLAVTIRRGSGDAAEELETNVTLADELPAYQHAFLGILPARALVRQLFQADSSTEEAGDNSSPDSGLTVRAIWPNSPAANAGIQSGDRITEISGEAITSIDEAIGQLNAQNPGDAIEIKIIRDGEPLEVEAELSQIPTAILSAEELNAPASERSEGAGSPELKELKLPEMPHVARYYLPTVTERAEASPPRAPGLILWLTDGRRESAEALAATWQPACDRDGLVLLIPSPGDATGWTADDLPYLAALMQTAPRRFAADPRRIVIVGEGKGGQLAYTVAYKARNLIRGVVAVDSPLPRTLEIPDNNAGDRLAVLSIHAQETPLATLIRDNLETIAEAGYPVTRIIRRPGDAADANELDATTHAKIARWIDALDRF
jgi:serine protease Do